MANQIHKKFTDEQVKNLMSRYVKGEKVLFDDIRYFFYITTRVDLTPAEVVESANQRCDQDYRLMSYNPWMPDFLKTWEAIRQFSTA